jgi:diguanylate cyclase
MARVASSLQAPPDRANAIEIIDQLIQLNLALTGANYDVWRCYVDGADQDLRRAIDAHVGAGAPFTQRDFDTWFERFVAGRQVSSEVAMASETLARELTGVIASLRRSGDESRAYGDALQAASRVDASELDAARFGDLVKDLMDATRQMAAQNQTLTAQIEERAQQVQTLSTALQTASAEAQTDGLTGLFNRRHFDRTIAASIEEATAKGAPLALIMADIDHFKRINDQWGHAVGDQVIRYVGQILSRRAPAGAIAARYGGEEFALILPRANLALAGTLAETLRQTVRAQRITKRSTGEIIGAVTISLGVAAYEPDESGLALIERADSHLYAAKRAGRDCVKGANLFKAA